MKIANKLIYVFSGGKPLRPWPARLGECLENAASLAVAGFAAAMEQFPGLSAVFLPLF